MVARPRRWSSFALPAAMALAPFEPRAPTLPLGPFQVTVLEGVALAAAALLLFDARARVRAGRPPLPLVLLALFAAVELVSAAASDDARGSLKFALRMAFMAVFAIGVSGAEPEDRRRALLALAAGGAAAAVLAVAEGAGLRALDPLLSAFREMPFNVAGVRRATAGSEYPNLGAACIAYGLLAAVAVGAARGWGAWTALVAVPFSLGLLFTYSRGALVALAVGLLAAAAVGARRVLSEPLVALGALALTSAAFLSGREVFQLRLASEGVESWYGARYEPAEGALSLAPGAATVTAVKVTNTGRKAWTDAGQFHLSYHWYDVDRRVAMDGGRTRLPRAMGPGDSAVLMAEVRAPGRPGAYLLLWDMVQEHTSWFSGQGVRPAVVRVSVGPTSSAPAAGAPTMPDTTGLAWRPGRSELWALAAAMWRAHPVLGVGPDRFRHLYGPWAGRAWWDDRVYANNLLLELAATVGTMGAALLAAAIVAAAVRAWRGRRDPARRMEAMAALSLLAFVAAHGVVDYVLAFTGHYLVLALAVAVASTLGPRA